MERNRMSKNKSSSLALQLKRKVQLKRHPVIAKMTFQRERPDLVSLLDAMQRNSRNMPARLKAYLKHELLWDEESSTLSEKGEQVKSSGLFNVEERGLYHIWYTDNDPLLGTRPLLLQRDTAFFEPNTKGWMKGVDAARSAFSVNETLQLEVLEEIYEGRKSRQVKKNLSLIKLEPEVICAAEKSVEVELSWGIGPSQSLVSLSGQLDMLVFNQNKTSGRPETLELVINGFSSKLDTLMNSIADQFEGEWQGRSRVMAVTLENIKQFPSAVENFKVSSRSLKDLPTNCGMFDSVQVQHVSIKPIDQNDAEQWHQYWLEAFYRKIYQSTEKARQQQTQWLDRQALSNFELPLKDGAFLLESIVREQEPEVFWHVAAMTDLTSTKSKKLHLPISLVNGDALQIKELMQQLSAGDTIEQVIYSDRYVHTSRQGRNLSELATSVGDAKGLLLTLEVKDGNSPQLPSNWVRVPFKKENNNHGRYWIFIGASHTYCWECSSGLDFILESGDNFVVAGTPGFTPKDEHELPGYLQEAIQAMKPMEVA
jgi:hypothetical protein